MASTCSVCNKRTDQHIKKDLDYCWKIFRIWRRDGWMQDHSFQQEY